ncbi:YkvA family protein [Bacillus subtilis]|uniref:YkvA family protein n=1 Tax=Bacillus subtilis TaxID=1423 RepID=UPI0024C10E29|nr:YkvA family protein [Bacillus subtilis]WHY10888.1 YkvA family protein [Bacillus subtilis]WPP27040.1 YkvA family protein [Bacillus subtilis]
MKKKKAIMLGAAGGKAILKRKNRKKCPQHITTFFQMLRDWRNGDYPRSQVKTLLLLTAAILYIVMPLDIIPDVILGLGFIDDAAVLGLIWTLIKKELSQYEKWRLQ